jgi:uncharacterized Zn-finger protein
MISESEFDTNGIESWETEGGALPRHTPVSFSTSSGALPAIRDGSYQVTEESLATSGANSTNKSRTRIKASRYPKFQNDRAVSEIRIGTRQFKCIGVTPPHDHPHVYIDMGDDDTILCPYCATRYRFDPKLALFESEPRDSIFVDPEEFRRLGEIGRLDGWIAWPTSCPRLDPVETESAQIGLIDKDIA